MIANFVMIEIFFMSNLIEVSRNTEMSLIIVPYACIKLSPLTTVAHTRLNSSTTLVWLL